MSTIRIVCRIFGVWLLKGFIIGLGAALALLGFWWASRGLYHEA